VLIEALMWTMGVGMGRVLTQYRVGVLLVVENNPVGALSCLGATRASANNQTRLALLVSRDFSSGTCYPETPMSMNFNTWFIDMASHAGGTSVYRQQVDYALHTVGEVLSPSEAAARVSAYRTAGVTPHKHGGKRWRHLPCARPRADDDHPDHCATAPAADDIPDRVPYDGANVHTNHATTGGLRCLLRRLLVRVVRRPGAGVTRMDRPR
jgi:hypothetical protein